MGCVTIHSSYVTEDEIYDFQGKYARYSTGQYWGAVHTGPESEVTKPSMRGETIPHPPAANTSASLR